MGEPELAALLAEHASAQSVPGAAIGVVRDGAVTTACYGVADLRAREPVTDETRFAAGSLAKTALATAIALLGVALDDPVAAHVPELRDAAWAHDATVRDLLANRAGGPLTNELEFETFAGEGDDVLARFAARVATAEPAGAFWSYTNAGWCLLGRALETVTGLRWEDAMRAAVFVPLGMDRVAFANEPVAERRAAGHAPAPVEPWTPRSLGPAGTTLLVTVDDLVRLAAAQLDDPALADLRVTHAEIRIHAWFDAWCLGLARFDWAGGPVWGWDGLISGQRAVLRILPEQRGAVVLLTNSATGRAVYRSLLPLVLDSFGIDMPRPELEPSPGAAGDLSRFAGVYAWPDRRVEIEVAGDAILVDGRTEALPLDERTFLLDADDPDVPTMTFGAFDDEGRPGVLYRMIWGLPRLL